MLVGCGTEPRASGPGLAVANLKEQTSGCVTVEDAEAGRRFLGWQVLPFPVQISPGKPHPLHRLDPNLRAQGTKTGEGAPRAAG